MNLCIDIGNTRFKFAVFNADELVEVRRVTDEEVTNTITELFDLYQIENMIASSTRKGIHPDILSREKETKLFIELGHQSELPISIHYKTPSTLGRDRIATAVGADYLYPDEACIIVDAGTCITYDFIDKEGNFLGGNIAPGMRMRLKAMNEYTANLPLVDKHLPGEILGKSTEEALQNGAIRGTIYEIDSFIRQIEKKYGDSRIILTGGDANNFVDYFKSKIFVVQNLALIGLNQILKHNAK